MERIIVLFVLALLSGGWLSCAPKQETEKPNKVDRFDRWSKVSKNGKECVKIGELYTNSMEVEISTNCLHKDGRTYILAVFFTKPPEMGSLIRFVTKKLGYKPKLKIIYVAEKYPGFILRVEN